MTSVHFSSKSAEHYTPPEIIRLVLDFWQCEQVDLDPCSHSKTHPFPSVLFYLGMDNYRFSQHFSTIGKIWRAWPCETEF